MVMPAYSDLLTLATPAPYTIVPSVANTLIGSSGTFFPLEELYVGLMIAPTWSASTAAIAGTTYVTGSAFPSTNRHVYVPLNSGTTGSTEPTWNTTPGGYTYDSNGINTLIWVEASSQFNRGVVLNELP